MQTSAAGEYIRCIFKILEVKVGKIPRPIISFSDLKYLKVNTQC
jgi:hypothetical protein